MQQKTLSLAAIVVVVSSACAEDSELPPEFRQLLARGRIAAVTEPHFVAADKATPNGEIGRWESHGHPATSGEWPQIDYAADGLWLWALSTMRPRRASRSMACSSQASPRAASRTLSRAASSTPR